MVCASTGTNTVEELWTLVQDCFARYLDECEAYGIRVEPRPELRRGKGLLCTYNVEDGAIYMAIADPARPFDRLQLLLFGSLVGCRSIDELLAFYRYLLPRTVAHELGHCFRHRYGRMGSDLWHEEHVANHLANALTVNALSLEERGEVRSLLQRGLAALSERVGVPNQAADSYSSALCGLGATGQLDDGAIQSLSLLSGLLAMPAEELLQSSGLLAGEEAAWRERREDLIGIFNGQYAADITRYLYYALGWWSIALEGRERHYVDEFARLHLGVDPELLPVVSEGATEPAVRACYRAHQELGPRSPTAARYFYKRYRALLLELLSEEPEDGSALNAVAREEVLALLRCFGDPKTDALGLLCRLASPSLAALFPHTITPGSEGVPFDPDTLPAETDRRLWAHAAVGSADRTAARTLERLSILEQCAIFRPLPAEILLTLARNLYRVFLAPGQVLLRKGDLNTDVFIVVRGALEVVVRGPGGEQPVARLGPGDILGEMAFFSREPRSATVRAVAAAECFVLGSTSLRRLGMQHPDLFSEMAGVLAKRLARRLDPLPETG